MLRRIQFILFMMSLENLNRQHSSYLFRFYFSCCEVFNTVQKAGFCKFIVGSKKFLILFYLIRFWYLCSHIPWYVY